MYVLVWGGTVVQRLAPSPHRKEALGSNLSPLCAPVSSTQAMQIIRSSYTKWPIGVNSCPSVSALQ